MLIKFLPGGCLNERGPFQPGQEIRVPNDQGIQLIASGLAVAVESYAARPITITVNMKNGGVNHA